MKALQLICALLCVLFSQAQRPKPTIYINPSVGSFRLTTDNSNINNSPIMYEGKIGIMMKKNTGVGLLFSSTAQSTPTSGRSSIQPLGGVPVWTRQGTLRHKATAVGIFYERFISINKKLDLFPGAYLQYLDFTDIESGNILAGTDTLGILYERRNLRRYIGRLGVNINVQYRISPSVSATLRFAQIDCRLWYKYNGQNIFLELPLLVGIKYSFN
jgi:hypothetical protein